MSADHNTNDLRSPTERQNIKLVIKRERKSTEVRSPTDNNTKIVPNNNALLPAIPKEKPSEVGTQSMKANEKGTAASDLDSNANWTQSRCYPYDNIVSTIKSTKNLAKSSPGKVAVKRKLNKGSKSYDRNGYKENSYPSMASGIGQIYTSNCGVNLGQQESELIPSHNSDQKNMQEPAATNQQNTTFNYHSDNQTGEQSFDNQTAKQTSNQNEAHGEYDGASWQPPNKVIKTEKLSPNSHEQSTHCRELSTPYHELPTVSQEQPTGTHDQLRDINDNMTNIHAQVTYNHVHPPYYREQSTDIHEQASDSSYPHEWQTESSEDHIMNLVSEPTYNDEVATTTNKELTNNPDMTSVDSIAKQRADDSTYTETQATSTVILEQNVTASQRDSKVATGNVTSESEGPVRKAMVVKIRRDKIGSIKTIRKPIKLKGLLFFCFVLSKMSPRLVNVVAPLTSQVRRV